MRFDELKIETRREAPARARTPGGALLVRAGYMSADGELLELGRRAVRRMQAAAESGRDVIADLHIEVLPSRSTRQLFELPGGDTALLKCPECGYADALAWARVRKPLLGSQPPLPLEKVSTPDCASIDSLAAYLRIGKDRTAKALLYTRAFGDQLLFALVRGDTQLSEMKLLAFAPDARLASVEEILRAGAVPGFASPIGLEGVQVVVDELIAQSANLVAGANEMGYHLLNTNCGRDYEPQAVMDLVLARAGDACPICGSPLAAAFGLIVGDERGCRFGNMLLAAAEMYHDEHGLCLPAAASPFDVYLMQLPSKGLDCRAAAETLHAELGMAGIEVLFDDREERAGVKFNDADLIGCPIRLTIGERNLKDGMVELKGRTQASKQLIPVDATVSAVRAGLSLPE